MLNAAGPVVYAHHAVRHIFRRVQVAGPAAFFLRLELGEKLLFCQACTILFRPVSGADGAASLRKQLCRSGKLFFRLDEADILAPLPLGQLGDGVAGAPLLIQLRAAQTGALPALFAPPCVDLLVVAAQQNVGHGAALPDLGAGVLGVFQQAVPIALFLVALLLRQNAGLEAEDAVGHHEAGQLAAGEDIVADRDLFVRKRFNDALVDALIVAADQRQVIVLGQPAGVLLGVTLTARRQEHDMRGRASLFRHLFLDGAQAVGDGLGIEHHAAAAAIGVVVGLLLLVEGVIPDLMAVGLDVAAPGCAADDAGVQHLLAHLREKGHDVHTHSHRSLLLPLTVEIVVQQARDGGDEDIAFRRVALFEKGVHAGEHIFPAAGGLDRIDVLCAGVVHAGDDAVHLSGVGVPHLAADEVGHIPPALGQGGVAAVEVEHLTPQRAGGVHIVHALQLEQRHLPLRADGGDVIAPAALCRGVETARLFEEIHAVAPQLQLHFAAHTVGGDDLACFQILLHKFAPVL